MDLLFICMVAVNGWAFLTYTFDKHRAQENGWRVPENTLLAVAFLGPFGAYAAMRFFRHKTRKLKFYLVPVFLAVQAGIIMWFVFFWQ